MTTERWVVRHAIIYANENEYVHATVSENALAFTAQATHCQAHITKQRAFTKIVRAMPRPKDIEIHKLWNQSETCTKDQY